MLLFNPTLCIPSHNLLNPDLLKGANIDYLGNQVWLFPFLSKATCDALVDEAEQQATLFKRNKEEDDDYQIPELVLQQECPSLYHSLLTLQQEALAPMVKRVAKMRAPINRTIQIARYLTGDKGSFHYDDDSDLTFVTKLEDADMRHGTDTELTLGRAGVHRIHSHEVPVGYTLVFNGKMHMHRGGKVIGKQRHLLVSWNETK